jgi:hypothetical protein
VNSKTTPGFWANYRDLPIEIQKAASEKYAIWQRDPFHPSLHFKEIDDDLWSIRVNRNYRALARSKKRSHHLVLDRHASRI